jgi:hypothetical protein
MWGLAAILNHLSSETDVLRNSKEVPELDTVQKICTLKSLIRCVFLAKYYYVGGDKDGDVGGACSTDGRYDKRIKT